jgi:hypothetical protein
MPEDEYELELCTRKEMGDDYIDQPAVSSGLSED